MIKYVVGFFVFFNIGLDLLKAVTTFRNHNNMHDKEKKILKNAMWVVAVMTFVVVGMATFYRTPTYYKDQITKRPYVFASSKPEVTSAVIRDGESAMVTRGPAIDHAKTDLIIFNSINMERARRKLPPLRQSAQLREAAQKHSENMAQYNTLNHFSMPSGAHWADRAKAAGYPNASLYNIGENVAGWQVSGQQAVSDWMKSPGHRAAILGNWRDVGSGSATSKKSGLSYWTTAFGRPR